MKKDYRKLKKDLLVKAFGSKCIICGYDKCNRGLEFHHKDESSKNFGISQAANVKWETLLNEAKKCILVCCRCHREIHENMINIEDINNEINYDEIKNLFKPNNGKEKKNQKKCQICDKKTKNKFCSLKCSAKSQEKIKWDDEELKQLYVNEKVNVKKLSEKYNVSYNAVKKRLIKLKIFGPIV